MVIFKEEKLQIYVLMTPHLSAAITSAVHCAAGGLVISAQSVKKKKKAQRSSDERRDGRNGGAMGSYCLHGAINTSACGRRRYTLDAHLAEVNTLIS